MVTNIITIYGQEITVGKDYRNYYSGDFTKEKIVKYIQPIEKSIHRVIFNDLSWIDVNNNNISKIVTVEE